MSENARKLDALITETRFDELKTKLAAAEARVKVLEESLQHANRDQIAAQCLKTENAKLAARVKELEGMLALSPETRGDIGALANKVAADLLLEENAEFREALRLILVQRENHPDDAWDNIYRLASEALTSRVSLSDEGEKK